MPEPWRPLLTDPPRSFQRLPLMARGVWVELYRIIGSDRIPLRGEQPWQAVAFVCGTSGRERVAVKNAVKVLLDAECILTEGDSIRCHLAPEHPSFRGISGNESPPTGNAVSAESPSSQRGVGVESPSSDRRVSVEYEGVNVSNHSGSITEENRLEENRIEHPPTPHPGGRLRRVLIRGYANRHNERRAGQWNSALKNWVDINSVAKWLETWARCDEDVGEWLDNWFADPWHDEHSWPWSACAKNPSRFLKPPQARRGPAPASKEWPEPDDPEKLFGVVS